MEHHRLIGPMDQIGPAEDNPAIESFYSPPQNSALDPQPWRTKEELPTRISSPKEEAEGAGEGRFIPIAYEEKLLTQALRPAT